MQLLLISNSWPCGGGYLDHAEAAIRELLSGSSTVAFVPYALRDWDGYFRIAQERFERMGFTMRSVHHADDPHQVVRQADSTFIGGGNSFRLLAQLYKSNLLETIRDAVAGGKKYLGASAGVNVACPTIMTTNDMPIVSPPSLRALGLTWFQVNAHYLDPDPGSKHMGETREERIMQFHEENQIPVVALREGSMLRVEGETVELIGTASGRIFRYGMSPLDVHPDTRIQNLISATGQSNVYGGIQA